VSDRLQAVVVAVFLLVVAGAVLVLLPMRDDDPAPTAKRSSGPDLDSAESGPTGRVIFEGREKTLLRVRSGSCTKPGGPKLELSTNVGRTFRPVRMPQLDEGRGIDASTPTVRAIVRASAASARKLNVLGADKSCTVHSYTSTDGGETWKQKAGRPGAWYLDPKNGFVVSPKGPTDAGCKESALLAPIDADAAVVVCDGGRLRTSTDAGASWRDSGQLDDVTSVVFTSPSTGFVTTRGSACASRVRYTTDGGATWTPTGCVVKDFIIPAIAVVGDRLVAGGSGGALVSEDRGDSWGPSKKK
jgi:hypothetical protein